MHSNCKEKTLIENGLDQLQYNHFIPRMQPSQDKLQVRSNSLPRCYFERRQHHWGKYSFHCSFHCSFRCSFHLTCKSCFLRQKGRKFRMNSRLEPFLPGAGPEQLLEIYSLLILCFVSTLTLQKRMDSAFAIYNSLCHYHK